MKVKHSLCNVDTVLSDLSFAIVSPGLWFPILLITKTSKNILLTSQSQNVGLGVHSYIAAAKIFLSTYYVVGMRVDLRIGMNKTASTIHSHQPSSLNFPYLLTEFLEIPKQF